MKANIKIQNYIIDYNKLYIFVNIQNYIDFYFIMHIYK